jgi:multidrug efflux pump subunit AcrB
MERLIRWFVNNTVAANMVMLFILVAGLLTLPRIRMEVFPDINIDVISISVIYPGASPKDVEEGICYRIEEKLTGLKGIKRIRSSASENIGVTTVEILPGEDVNEIQNKIKTQIDAIDTFPDNAEKPTIQNMTGTSDVITVAVYGDIEEESLVAISENIKDEIDGLPEISLTTIIGKKPREISIEISELTLKKHQLSIAQVARSIRLNSMDIPGGAIETNMGEILIRSKGQVYDQRGFANIPIISRQDGATLLLGDIAEIKDGFAKVDLSQKFNGSPSILIRVFRVGDQNALDISSAVKKYVDQISSTLPKGVGIKTWNDEAIILKGRIDLLLKNAYLGLILVVTILAIFLKPKLAFWVSLGIPISFMGGFLLMPIFDVSINMLSLFTFILVLGIVVDDAIVVGENIFLWRERGLSGIEAAVKGATQVSVPVIFAILTTIAAFSPMLSVAGNIGQIWRIIPLVTIIVLVFSLIESLAILPAHLGHIDDEKLSRFRIINVLSQRWGKFQDKIKSRLDNFINEKYKPFLAWTLNHKGTTLAASAGVFILTIGLIAGGWIKFVFFPPLEADLVNGTISYPDGSPIRMSMDGLGVIESSAQKLKKQLALEYPGEDIFVNILATAGDQPVKNKSSQGPGGAGSEATGTHYAEYAIELSPGESRSVSATEIARRWRELTPTIIGAKEVVFTSELFSAGDPINIQLVSQSILDLNAVSVLLQEKLATYPGVIDIKDSFSLGKEEIKLILKPKAKNYGITMVDVSNQVRQAFYGLEVQNFQRGRDEIKVFIRYPEQERKTIKNLESLQVRNSLGVEVPLRQVVDMEFTQGFSAISRVDRQRSVNITANVDISKVTANEVLSAITQVDLPLLLKNYPSVRFSLEGEQREQNDSLGSIFKNFIFAMIVIYTLLAIPFRSYSQPLVVMGAIPFGLTGAIIGHIIMGQNLTILSLIGIVALAGVVVNDSLVLVDFINRYRADGHAVYEAVLEAGPRRFRPILLTSLTTFFGLFPLLMEKSVQAQFLIPMAISLAYGVLFATVITLVIVPSAYLFIDNLKDMQKGRGKVI